MLIIKNHREHEIVIIRNLVLCNQAVNLQIRIFYSRKLLSFHLHITTLEMFDSIVLFVPVVIAGAIFLVIKVCDQIKYFRDTNGVDERGQILQQSNSSLK